MIQTFQNNGYLIEPEVISSNDCDRIAKHLALENPSAVGTRRLLEQPWCSALASLIKQHSLLSQVMPADAVAVQCTLFSKSDETNWSVSAHQDLSIPVAFHVNTPLCGGWCRKEGYLFTQPPADVLSNLIAVRLHIDECGTGAGPLRVLPGSHLDGRLTSLKLSASSDRIPEKICIVPRGGALIIRPLLVHASSKAVASLNRRVLHFLFGPPSLPLGLQWAYAI